MSQKYDMQNIHKHPIHVNINFNIKEVITDNLLIVYQFSSEQSYT